MFLFSEEGLADTVGSFDGSQSEAEFDAGPTTSITPVILPKELASEAAGESELSRVCLADSHTVKCADHWVQQVRHQQPFKFVPAICGGHQVKALAINGPQK